jgi:PAS domain S-box-containing protein
MWPSDASGALPSTVRYDSGAPPAVGGTAAGAAVSSGSAPAVAPAMEMHRLIHVNRAFERLSGLTQAELSESLQHADAPAHASAQVRSDHIAASHRLMLKWRLSNEPEMRMHQVRYHKDGREIYCLVHMHASLEQGMFLGAIKSIIPMPIDEEHPMPPFRQGEDLDEETILYGYRKPNDAHEACRRGTPMMV